MNRLILLLMAVSAVSWVSARPVSYPGGVTLMQTNDYDANNLHLHYSPTAKYSIGYKGEFYRSSDLSFHGVQLNYLAKRWNQQASQANLYVKSALGFLYGEGTPDALAGSVGLAADWETRRYFTSYEGRWFDSEESKSKFTHKTRLGVAPYIGDYGDLHTWLMLQLDYLSQPQEQELIVTPLVRFFKDAYMLEAGVSSKETALINLIVRF